jgi:hypothetical protein
LLIIINELISLNLKSNEEIIDFDKSVLPAPDGPKRIIRIFPLLIDSTIDLTKIGRMFKESSSEG